MGLFLGVLLEVLVRTAVALVIVAGSPAPVPSPEQSPLVPLANVEALAADEIPGLEPADSPLPISNSEETP